jgi:hypothetical protein
MEPWNFLKKIYYKVFGYEITKNIQEFIDVNKKYWKDINGSASNGYILLPFKNTATNFVLSSRTVKAIEEETGCLPLVLLDAFSFSSKYSKSIYQSFNINNFFYYRNYLFNIFYLGKALYLTAKFYFKQKEIRDLLELEFNGIYLGDLLYDTILRRSNGLYTIDKFKFRYNKYVFYAFLHLFICKKIFRQYKIKYVYLNLVIFIKWGILARMADKNGAVVIMAKRNLMKNYKGLNIREGQYVPRKSDVSLLRKSTKVYSDIEMYLTKRFSGDIYEVDATRSFKDKIYYDREKLCKALNIDTNKPLVFIMTHAFSDGPHHSPRENLLFRDYYIWLVETIKYVSTIRNINWIVKPHPMSLKYGEEGVVEKLVEEFGDDNVHITPKDFNTSCIKDIAHALVTVQGKAALEFGCFGVPSVITSRASYSGFGIVVEPKTKEEYFDILKHINSISRLNEEQIKTAKVLAAIMFIYSRTKDPLFSWEQNFFNPKSEESKWEQLCFLIKKYDRLNDEFYQRVKDLLRLNLYKKYLN